MWTHLFILSWYNAEAECLLLFKLLWGRIQFVVAPRHDLGSKKPPLRMMTELNGSTERAPVNRCARQCRKRHWKKNDGYCEPECR